MAYNPFNVFRRNQKTLFAILTIIIMIVFTLSFGAGDFFQWLPTLVGKSGNRGDAVASVNGSKVYEADLQKITMNRVLASDFMSASNAIAIQKVDTAIADAIGNVSKDLRPQISQFRQMRQGNDRIPPYFQFTQQNIQALMSNPNAGPMLMQQGMFITRQQFSEMLTNPALTGEDKDVIRAALSLVNLDQRQFDSSMGFFGHKAYGEESLKGALDFDLWLKEADKLGIKYSESDAQAMYLDEFYGQTDSKSLAEMEKNMFKDRSGYSRDTIFKALADEFRVRTVQQVVLGRGGPNGTQAVATPWDSYEYFRKLCNGGTYAVMTVPAENYLSKVQGEPSESEMRKLFDAYRSREADPAKDNLGLRESRKLKIGWLEVKGDEPYYKKLGAEALAAAEVHARAFAAATIPLPGGGFEMLITPAVFNLQDPALTGAYAAFKDKYGITLDTAWFPYFASSAQPLDASVLKPAAIAALTAIAGSSGVTHAGLLPVALAFVEKARIDDRGDRARAFGSLLTVPTTGGSFLIGPALVTGSRLPPAPTLAMVRSELVEKVKVEAVRAAAERDLLHFEAELRKIADDKEKKDKVGEGKAYIAKFIAERGLTSGESKSFDNQWTIGQDAGLQPLIDKAIKLNVRPDAPLDFGRNFFFDYDPRTGREVPASTFFTAEPFPDRAQISIKDGETVFMAWRTEEIAAETPKDFTATKPRIIELWKRIESRKLAAAAAEEMAKEVREQAKAEHLDTRPEDLSTTPIVDRIVSDVFLRSQSRYHTESERERASRFDIRDVAMVSMPEQLFAMQQVQPRPFQLLPTKQMPYPTFAMQQALLENKDGKPATTLVLNEESKDRYYVAVLKHRQDRRSDDFYSQVYSGIGPLSNEVRGTLQQEEGRAAFRQAMALMRAEFKVEILNEKLR